MKRKINNTRKNIFLGFAIGFLSVGVLAGVGSFINSGNDWYDDLTSISEMESSSNVTSDTSSSEEEISSSEELDSVTSESVEKITPEITFNNLAGGSFYSTDLDWMHNVPSDAEYEVTYTCGDLGIEGATYPEDNGYGWSQIINVKENEVYNATSSYSPWFYYKGYSNVEIRGFDGEEYGASVDDSSSRDYAMDGDTSTYLWIKYPKKEDAYIEWTLDEPLDIFYITCSLGKSDNSDFFKSTLSVSTDKKTYVECGYYESNSGTQTVDLTGVKYIRLTNAGTDSWVAIREIVIGEKS